ncbi:MAG: prepilin peptidase [Phycisphaerales bacterium]|nr:prepilin peptidase [Hyphomonadaceae bacterium]
MSMIGLVALAVFAGLLLYAAATDATRLIIPNWLSLALAAIYPAAALMNGAPLTDVGVHLLFAAGVLAVGFFLFAANVIGGGDAKLLAGAAVWTGPEAFLVFIVWTVVAGGVLAAALLAARLMLRAETSPPMVAHLLQKQNGIPYGVAIMIGGLIAMPAIPYLSTSDLTSLLTLP